MNYGFIKTAAITPDIRVADCMYNAAQIAKGIRAAAERGVQLAVFPELCVTGYTCGELFLQRALLDGALEALRRIVQETRECALAAAVGLPLEWNGKLYNCAAVFSQGSLLGFVPKSQLPNYGEFYEARHFTPAPESVKTLMWEGGQVPFGTDILFTCREWQDFRFAVEICEDLWVPAPPSQRHAAAGATVIVNLSASNETVGKNAYRRNLVTGQSARLTAGYVYCDAGNGESTTDLVFAGHNLIAENGSLLAESALFETGMIVADIDVERMAGERRRLSTFVCVGREAYVETAFSLDCKPQPLNRIIPAYPFLPPEGERDSRCEEIFAIQAAGLRKRVEHTLSSSLVIGISGGLDSCLALLVSVRVMDLLGLPRTDVTAVTMPCFGTTKRTKSNAVRLSEILGVTLREINITAAVEQHFSDIGHDAGKQDVTYENAQARERTQVLMDIANELGGLVVGTGDLSELALGWATYNGDHMSMYGVNASIPKTLLRHMVRHIAESWKDAELHAVLLDILDTPVSPELLPAREGDIAQKTEELVGPYALHDFFLYYVVRWGFRPDKVYFLARQAFCGEYTDAVILKWLEIFYRRFFSQQFKRSCMPDGPKVGSVALSPRGDWRMPSDASAALWLDSL